VKYALIGDVHANLPALEAVLADAEHKSVEQIWNVGDWVGYNAFPVGRKKMISESLPLWAGPSKTRKGVRE
jgi:predicted phosphodiesterase